MNFEEGSRKSRVTGSKTDKSEKSEMSYLTLSEIIKPFPNDQTTNYNSLVNNPSNNRLSDLITVQLSKEDSYDFEVQKINFKNFMEMKDRVPKRGGTTSENISTRKDNDLAKFNKTMNGTSSAGKINLKWQMLMNSPEFGLILDQINMEDQKAFGIDLQAPANYGKGDQTSTRERGPGSARRKGRTLRDKAGRRRQTDSDRTSWKRKPKRMETCRSISSILTSCQEMRVRRLWRTSRTGR